MTPANSTHVLRYNAPRCIVEIMNAFFTACAVLGGGILVVQLVLGLIGLDHGLAHDMHLDDGHGHASEGMNLKSARALAAGLAFFGLGGLVVMQWGLGSLLAVLGGAALGGIALVGTAKVLRSFARLEHDGTLQIDRAIGQSGTVYLAIPEHRTGMGKVHVTVQDRIVECAAVTPDAGLPTGSPVLVVDVEGTDTLVVVRNSPLLEDNNVSA